MEQPIKCSRALKGLAAHLGQGPDPHIKAHYMYRAYLIHKWTPSGVLYIVRKDGVFKQSCCSNETQVVFSVDAFPFIYSHI